MRLPRTPWLLSFTALGALSMAHVAGCGGGGSTSSQAGGTTGTGGTKGTGGASASSSSGSGGSGGGAAVCGDGIVEGTEECDTGAMNGTGTGCSSSCTWDCLATDPTRNCTSKDACVANGTCGATHVCTAGAALAQGASCGTNLYCVANNCVAPSCGDGVVEGNEECDDGNTTNGDGCDNDCKFTCLSTDPTRDCASTNVCVAMGTCGTTHVCTAGAAVSNGTACTGGMCESGTCTVASCVNAAKCAACTTGFCNGGGATGTCNASTCGDGCVDPSKGEQCDPPNGTTCSATCQTIAVTAVCGNGVIEAGEQCDDGNLLDLDGCDSKCKYEVVERMTAVAIAGTAAPASMGCTPATNALGAKAITGTALGVLNPDLQTAITAGTTNVITQFLGLTDLAGVSDTTPFNVGILDGTLDPAKGTWPTTGNPQDWWFLADPSTVAMGLPTGLMSATINAQTLTGGPSNVTLALLLGGSPASLVMRSARITAKVGAADAPTAPPAKVATGLTVFETLTANGTGQGLCGNITVASLAQIPVPSALTSGISNCSQGYIPCVAPKTLAAGTCNSLLDVLVSGCSIILGSLINKTQPDVPAGTTITTLVPGANHVIPTTVTGADDDAYSSYLTFTANRAHFTGETCSTTSSTNQCQAGQTCTAGVCK